MTDAAPFSMTAAEVAAAVGGTLTGSGDAVVNGIAPLDRASARELSFLATAKYAPLFERSLAGVVLLTAELASAPGQCAARVVVAKPHDALLSLIPRFYSPPAREAGVHPTAIVSPAARVGAGATVEAYAVIRAGAEIGDRAWIGSHSVIGEGVTIGADVRLLPHVTLYPGTRLGDRVTVHSGARLGSDGFGYVFRGGAHEKIPHAGRCLIGNDVEIGANSAIDRGSIDDTVVGDGTKIDNLVHIGHNVRIGRLCLLMAQVGVAGSSRVDDGAILAGQVGIAGHLTVGAGARLAAQAGVISDIPAGETWGGYPARPHRESLKASAALFKLSDMMKRIERLLDREEQ
ncbi:MAG: UDP-3-O-(3-hydroxymyristoyl)glucosamine N-acyltransferase [Gemmatimonadales bacterium]